MVCSASDRKILFVHIPKTAGLSLNLEFRRVYAEKAIITHGFFPLQHDLKSKDLKDIDYIGGHVTYPQFRTALSEEPSNHFCVSMIREPLRRAISHYLFILRTDNEPMQKIRAPFVGKSFEHFVNHAAEHMPELIVNTQCTYLSGVGNAEEAMKAIETNYSVVAMTERFSDLHDAVRLETGNKISPWRDDRRANVAPSANGNGQVAKGHMPQELAELAPPHVLRKLEQVAEEDFKLYETFQKRHAGLFRSIAPAGA